MNIDNQYELKRLDFTNDITESFNSLHYAKEFWPVVYILSDGTIKEAYVGETTDLYERMKTHLKSNDKKKLSVFHMIASGKFNKSATLDIESNLIKYISGDGQYQLINANIGLANHNYYQKKEIYWQVFKSIWQRLRSEGIAKHSIDYIDNSDLFKYSPYKSLDRGQSRTLLAILKNLLDDDIRTTLVEGGAGTGKTILAVFLFKLLNSRAEDLNYKEFGDEEAEFIETIKQLKIKYPTPKMALVVPMSSLRGTLKKIFKNIKGLDVSMVVAPADISRNNFDIVLVDESHRLRRRVNLGTYYKAFGEACERLGMNKENCSELDWVLQQSRKSVFFYDEKQSIKPSDALTADFIRLKASLGTNIQKLVSQFRVKGGLDYVEYVNKLIDCSFVPGDKVFNSQHYSFLFFDSIDAMVQAIKQRDEEHRLSRLIAGYAWKWVSKKDKTLFDIHIENCSLRWNTVSEDWINSPGSAFEVGCIHTTQGYDLNYAGVIFGNEISYDKEKNEIVILEKNYFDRNGKVSIKDPAVLKAFIANIYKTILLRGIRGTYVYACDKNLREYLAQHIPHAEAKAIAPVVSIRKAESSSNKVALYDLKAAAGQFSESHQADSNEWVTLPAHIKPSKNLFACTVVGESMNKVIPNGSICLFRRYEGGPRHGQIVLVQHTSIQDKDFGSGFTVKEYRSKKIYDGSGWKHESITLFPLSYDESFQPIDLRDDKLSQVNVLGVFECVL